MKDFFKLIRWQNLVIVVITMVSMRYFVISPLIGNVKVFLTSGLGGADPMLIQSPWYDFALLVFATVCLTAAGYVINDYFDIRTDLINKGKVIVGTKIPRRQAMMWHNLLNIIGVACGFYVSWRAGYFWLGSFFLLVSGLLYFYSASYKRQFLIGNIIVAFLTAMVPMLVVIFEWPYLFRYYSLNAISLPNFNFILYWVGGFALFAFLTTLIREIVKDIEDFEGDIAYGRNTVPVVIGILSARIVSVCLIIITIVLLFLAWYFFIFDIVTVIYISAAIVIPLLYIVYKIMISKERKHFHLASSILKIVMLSGIVYSGLVKIMLTWNLLL